MGMESFFVVVLPKEVKCVKTENGSNSYIGSSNLQRTEMLKLIRQNFLVNDKKTTADTFSLNELVEMDFNCTVDDKVINLVLEICFYHYDIGIQIVFELYELLVGEYDSIRLFHPRVGYISCSSLRDFKDTMDSIYKNKCQTFKNEYGILSNNDKVLPGKNFDDYVMKKGFLRRKL